MEKLSQNSNWLVAVYTEVKSPVAIIDGKKVKAKSIKKFFQEALIP